MTGNLNAQLVAAQIEYARGVRQVGARVIPVDEVAECEADRPMRRGWQIHLVLAQAYVEPVGIGEQSRKIGPVRLQMHVAVGGEAGRNDQE